MPSFPSRRSLRTLVSLLPFFPSSSAHMSIWHPSMYGVEAGFSYEAGDPVAPLGSGVQKLEDWWFRGPRARALKPQNDSVMELPAGGGAKIEIACNVAWTSYGSRTTDPSDPLSACPDNYGAYHTGDPAGPLDDKLLSGCALAVEYKNDIEEVGWDDLVVFSTNQTCVRERVTTFEIPERMPPCPNGKCVCAWLWLANNGTANFYVTGFDCTFTNIDPSLARPLLPPVDPVFCPADNTTCTPATGAKRPLFAYNSPSNVVWEGNDARPGYHASWSFTIDGAQDDIFQEEETDSLRSSTVIATLPSSAGGAQTVPNRLSLSKASTSPSLSLTFSSSLPPSPLPTTTQASRHPSTAASAPASPATGVARIVGDLEDLSDMTAQTRDLTLTVEELRASGEAEEPTSSAARPRHGGELVLALVSVAVLVL
ncbi:hypothetical protein NBRC10513_000803 [Rhodotorula toruloides]|uniref:Proteophosphoglycan ppg4 n=1 Tax=Rhodotorula toruloides TaxID=5286 RepID=A0A2S9ZZM2_RHOTO|nr:hypothetical protein AAT19DRAFT_10739 [Rhodotorula toruloides]